MSYRKCFIPTCENDSKNSPDKIFVRVREDLRESWCREVNAEYYKVYTIYCCEDHISPQKDLKNYYKHKLMNEEPILKPTATLKNIAIKPLGDIPSTSQNFELRNILLPTQKDPAAPKKRKLENVDMSSTSSTSTLPVKVHVGTQCELKMVDKSVQFKTRKRTTATEVFEVHSSQEISSATTPSLFGCTSETEDTTSEKISKSKIQIRNNMLDIMFKKPKMYLGLPKQFLWLIDYIAAKSSSQVDSLTLIATLFKIKQNDSVERISDQLCLSRTKLSMMILNGTEVLANFFQNLIICPNQKQIKKNLPLVFKIRYSDVQMIIDCFEIQISKPSDPLKQAQTWSQYKNCNTVKYLIGCTPNGLINFISQGYGGRISDKALVEKSNLLDVLQPNAFVLADRGFKEIEPILNSHGVKLLRPPSVFTGVKQSVAETLHSKVVASLRVHVERVIRRVREFDMLKPHSVVNYKYVSYLDEIVIIACGLINLQDEIIKSC